MLKNTLWFLAGCTTTAALSVLLTRIITKQDPTYLDAAIDFYKRP